MTQASKTRTGPTWTIAYRKPRANRFQRATDLELTWTQAYYAAGTFAEAHPNLQVFYVTSRAWEIHSAAEIAAGRMAPEYAEDHGNVMVDSGKRVRMIDNGSYGDLPLLSADDAAAHYRARANY